MPISKLHLPKKHHKYINRDNQNSIMRAISAIDCRAESLPADIVWKWLGRPYNFEDNLRILEAGGRIEIYDTGDRPNRSMGPSPHLWRLRIKAIDW